MVVYTESFDLGADNIDLADQTLDLTWAYVTGNSNEWETYQGGASPRGSTRSLVEVNRAEHDTSGSDMYAQLVVTALASGSQGGPCLRFSSSGATCYFAEVFGNGNVSIQKYIDGSRSTIATTSGHTVTGLPKVLRLEASGSTLTAFWDGVQAVQTTDTDIPSGTRAGLAGFESSGESLGFVCDDFEFGDLSAPGTPVDINDSVVISIADSISIEAFEGPSLIDSIEITVDDEARVTSEWSDPATTMVDDIAIQISDTISIQKTVEVGLSDNISVGISDQSSVSLTGEIEVSLSDAASISILDSIEVENILELADSLIVTVDDQLSVDISGAIGVPTSDDASIVIDDSISVQIIVPVNLSDDMQIDVDDQLAADVSGVMEKVISDDVSVSISETATSSILAEIELNDELSISISESISSSESNPEQDTDVEVDVVISQPTPVSVEVLNAQENVLVESPETTSVVIDEATTESVLVTDDNSADVTFD